MAIAPVDLQTIFTQVDKVGKAQAAQREGQALAQSMQQVQIQKKIEQDVNQVNEAQNTGSGTEKVKDRNHDQDGQKQNGQKKDKEKEEEEKGPSVLRDPSLGKNIDISL